MEIRGSVDKMETLSNVRFWTAMRHTFPERETSMNIARLRARLAQPLTDVKSTES